MTFSDIIKTTKIPRLETEILSAFLLKKNREFLLTHPEIKITPAVFKKYQELSKKYLAGWSIASLTKKKDFYGREFIVNEHVLIPRPETELLVDNMLDKLIDYSEKQPPFIIDIGTGSGVIIISLALEIAKKNKKVLDRAEFRGVDISGSALKIAFKNAIYYKQSKRLKFLRGNLLEPLVTEKDLPYLLNSHLFIAANLPYLTPKQIASSPSIRKEPRLALVAGRDGLKYYRQLFGQIQTLFKDRDASGKRMITVFCEIDHVQVKGITSLAKEKFVHPEIIIKKDLAGLNRLVIITLKK